MHAKYEVSISYGSKVKAKVKVDNRQTNKQTDRRTGQKQFAPIIRSGSIITQSKFRLNKRSLLHACIPFVAEKGHWVLNFHTKIHQNPSSSSQEVENVYSLRDDKQTMCDHNRSLEPSSPMP